MKFIDNYIDKRVYSALQKLNFDVATDDPIMFDEKYSLYQNKILYKSDTAELIRWFKTHRPKNLMYNTNYFYRVVTGSVPIMHYPLPTIITKTMVNLLFSDNPTITAISGNKKYDKQLNELIKDIYDDNHAGALFQKAVEYESYSGSVAFKIVIDPEFSEYPIVIPYPKEDIEVITKYGRPTEIIFKDQYESNDQKYILYTIAGKGYIDYKLFKKGNKGNAENLKDVPLDELEETKELKRLEFRNRDGSLYENLMCVYKENKAGAQSDYANLVDDFAALDEIYTNMVDFIRKSKIKTYFPESLLQQNVQTGEKFIKNEYDSADIILYDSNPEGTTQEVKRDIADINNSIQGYKDAFNNVLLNALSTAGLSPATVGLDIAGANSSALALNIRERVSLRTKAEKQKRWNECLKELTKLLISLYACSEENGIVYLDAYNKEINIDFPEYETPTFSEQVTTLGEALNNNLIDLDTALAQLYPDKSEESLEIMKMNIEGQLPTGEDIVNKELDSDEEITEE